MSRKPQRNTLRNPLLWHLFKQWVERNLLEPELLDEVDFEAVDRSLTFDEAIEQVKRLYPAIWKEEEDPLAEALREEAEKAIQLLKEAVEARVPEVRARIIEEFQRLFPRPRPKVTIEVPAPPPLPAPPGPPPPRFSPEEIDVLFNTFREVFAAQLKREPFSRERDEFDRLVESLQRTSLTLEGARREVSGLARTLVALALERRVLVRVFTTEELGVLRERFVEVFRELLARDPSRVEFEQFEDFVSRMRAGISLEEADREVRRFAERLARQRVEALPLPAPEALDELRRLREAADLLGRPFTQEPTVRLVRDPVTGELFPKLDDTSIRILRRILRFPAEYFDAAPRRQESQFGFLTIQVYLKDLLKHAAIDLRFEEFVRKVVELLERQTGIRLEDP